ncbi:hypothetical protein VUR80DRAFT_5668 [Thermomyces stellatus]
MRPPRITIALTSLLSTLPLRTAADTQGYLDHVVSQKGDPGSADSDVYFNASVDVESIRVDVSNVVAKVNVDARVLEVLRFSAGVNASI